MTKPMASGQNFARAKRTTHLTRGMHIVRLDGEDFHRLYETRTGIDPEAPERPVWVQTKTLWPQEARDFIDDFRAARLRPPAPPGRRRTLPYAA